MTTGIKDVDLKILMELDDDSLLEFCKTDKYGQKLCENEDFWRNRTFNKYGRVEKNPKRTWKNFYLKTVYYDNLYIPKQSLEKLSEGGMKNLDIIIFFISKGTNPNFGLIGAAKGDHEDLIDFFIEKGANINFGLKGAAEKGNRKLVDFFIEKGADNWNTGLLAAAKGGHKDLVDFFIEKGADDFVFSSIIAKNNGHKDLAYFLLKKIY